MKILFFVSGSISAYKTYDLLRAWIKDQHEVQVVLTQGALRFVKPEVFTYLGAQKVHLPQDDFISKNPGVLHVDLVKWCDRGVIAPLSAGLASRLTKGQAGDLASSIFLAWDKKKSLLLFPAMNSEMWTHPILKKNLSSVQNLPWVSIINPTEGKLACGDIGPGKLVDVDIIKELAYYLNPLKIINKKILISTGATVAPIDSVRYVTNPSSGITGVKLARAFLSQGYEVDLVVGHSAQNSADDLFYHPRCKIHSTPTTSEMLETISTLFPNCSLFISAAAVADIEFNIKPYKIKKADLNQLPIKHAVDILAQVLKIKKPKQKVVSFAAETETSAKVFNEKMKRKPVDLMIGNRVHSGLFGKKSLEGFQTTDGTYFFIKEDSISKPQKLTKDMLAQKILEWYTKENQK